MLECFCVLETPKFVKMHCYMLLVASEGLGVVALMLDCHFSSLLRLDPLIEIRAPLVMAGAVSQHVVEIWELLGERTVAPFGNEVRRLNGTGKLPGQAGGRWQVHAEHVVKA